MGGRLFVNLETLLKTMRFDPFSLGVGPMKYEQVLGCAKRKGGIKEIVSK